MPDDCSADDRNRPAQSWTACLLTFWRPAQEPDGDVDQCHRVQCRPLLCIWLSFLLYSFCHAPVPGVNEPHYLSKAKHYWNPDWCPGDLFLESSNPHLVFYQAFGPLTRILSFEHTAIAGRMIAFLILAFGWQLMCQQLNRDRWSGLAAAWIFLLLASIGNLSGEWLIGGVESKVLSYGLVLCGLAALANRHWCVAGVTCGLAVAFHPLVGMWSLVAIVLACAGTILQPGRVGLRTELMASSARTIRSPHFLAGMVLLTATALMGIVPALAVTAGATREETWYANFVQVYYRLAHHLDPMTFRFSAFAGYAFLSLLSLTLCRFSTDRRVVLMSRYVAAAGFIALVGLAIGWGPRPTDRTPLWEVRIALLKFYPFRLFDVMLPLLTSILVAGQFSSRRLASVLVPGRLRWGLLTSGLLIALWLNAGLGSINYMTSRQQRDWLAACQWLQANAPADALIYTPKDGWAFKWFAQRAEYVARKDCPQDAAGIREWNTRLNAMSEWGQAPENYRPDGGYSRESAQALSKQTGITYILSRRFGPFDVPVVFNSPTYRIYYIAPD